MDDSGEVFGAIPNALVDSGVVEPRATPVYRNVARFLDRARKGAADAREEICRALWMRLLEVARRRMREEDAQDVVQESMLTIVDRIEHHETPESLLGFAHGVLRNKIGNFYRKRNRHEQVVMAMGRPPEDSRTIDADLAGAELSRIVREAIDELSERSPHCRDVLLGLAEGKRYADLCIELGIPASLIDKRVFRARQALRSIIRKRLNRARMARLAGTGRQ
ncbi:MAG: sigma-70 family RNA polymerase sigma factor [Acidobacteria bacterium]|nr:sigma-70 family RNA polymerase sigma factor [Acidobacteriota bacterium]